MSDRNPWRRLATREVYRNAWIRVREDRVVRPDGEEGIYGVVETPLATAVVALTEAHEVVLVGQYRYPTDGYSWEVVEGGSHAGETALAAAQRELREEAGLVATDWVALGPPIHLSNCFTAEEGHCFLARGLREVDASPDATEQLVVRRVPWHACIAQVDDGSITDAMSIVALLRAERFLAGDAPAQS